MGKVLQIPSQVLSILNRIWQDHPECRPNFIVYNAACDLLCYIATQNVEDHWLTTTKFIVDAWHYVGHQARDALCRLWCNPSPLNGSQPDLILMFEESSI